MAENKCSAFLPNQEKGSKGMMVGLGGYVMGVASTETITGLCSILSEMYVGEPVPPICPHSGEYTPKTCPLINKK